MEFLLLSLRSYLCVYLWLLALQNNPPLWHQVRAKPISHSGEKLWKRLNVRKTSEIVRKNTSSFRPYNTGRPCEDGIKANICTYIKENFSKTDDNIWALCDIVIILILHIHLLIIMYVPMHSWFIISISCIKHIFIASTCLSIIHENVCVNTYSTIWKKQQI